MVISLFFTACSDLFQGKVAMPTKQNGSLEDLFYKPDEIVKLSAPTQFYVSNGYSSSLIVLNWDGVKGASSYLIERAVMKPIVSGSGVVTYDNPRDEDFDVIEQFCYSIKYTDNIFKSSTPVYSSPEYNYRYYYRVTAENIGKRYDSSDPTGILPGTLLGCPQMVKASMGMSDTVITVQWNKTNYANRYNIYRSDSPEVLPSNPLTTVTGNMTQYSNTIPARDQGKEYYYFVEAVNSSGAKSVSSNWAMGYTLTSGAPSKPENLRFAANSGRGDSTTEIKIEWDPGDAETYYAVFRSSSADSSLTRLTSNTSTPAYTDNSSLKPGIYYYYYVQAIKKNDQDVEEKSQLSDELEGFILSPPMTVFAKKNENLSISLIWVPAIGSETEQLHYSYSICGSNNLNGLFTPFDSAGSSVEADGYIHANNISSDYEFYKIITVKDTVQSNPSDPVAAPPDKAESVQATKAANLAGQTANSSGVYPVRINWSKPSTDNPAGYHIYRSTSEDSGFRKITEDPVPASAGSGGQFTYFDINDTAKVGKMYYYRVLSVNSLGQGDAFTNSEAGYGALTHEQYYLEYNKTIKSSHKKLTLMNKSGSTDKLGTETKSGTIGGTVYYNAKISGLGAAITMEYTNYADFYIDGDSTKGVSFSVSGNTNTSASMDQSGSMSGTMTAAGMYPGKVYYGNISIKGGVAAGGTYGVEPDGFGRAEVSFTLGNR